MHRALLQVARCVLLSSLGVSFPYASAQAASKSFVGNGSDASSKILYYDEDAAVGSSAVGYFPFGYYVESSGGNAGRLASIENLLGPAGFDVVGSASGAAGEVDKLEPMLQACAANHVTWLFGTYVTTSQDQQLNGTSAAKLMGLSGLLGWYHTDDANHGYPNFGAATHGYPVAAVGQRNAFVKSKDVNHVTSLSLTGGSSTEMKSAYTPQADFSGSQNYPMGNRNDRWDFWDSFDDAKAMTAAASAAATVPYTFTQAYTQGTYPKFPTAIDVDLQVYLSVCGGTKGIYFYAYRDELETTQVGFWDKTKQLAAELKGTDFGKAILFGKRTAVKLNEEAKGNLVPKYYGIWEYQRSTYVVAINIDPVSPRAISIPLPPTAVGAASKVFPYRSANLSYSSTGKLEGTLPTQTVEIYVVQTAVTTGPDGSGGAGVAGDGPGASGGAFADAGGTREGTAGSGGRGAAGGSSVGTPSQRGTSGCSVATPGRHRSAPLFVAVMAALWSRRRRRH